MPRLRGPVLELPPPEDRWPLLNEAIFGDPLRGGYHEKPLPREAPWSWSEVFGREAPLMLEVGFNRGKFITELAERHPDHNVVGIEIRRRFSVRLTQMLSRAGGPRNLRVAWGDAKLLVPTLFAPGSLSATFITFPDPWWKKRHEKRRLVDTQFAYDLAERLAPGGYVWVKSDVPMIADEIREALRARVEFEEPVPFESDDLPLTHRERSCLLKGLPIYRFKMQRNTLPLGDPPHSPPMVDHEEMER